MKNIIEKIQNQQWDDALELFLKYASSENMDENAYILGATITEHFGEYESMFSFISEGLKIDPNNYELYLLLGNYYSISNSDLAYLSYENALFHCIKAGADNDISSIEQLTNDYKQTHNISVRRSSIVILSYNTLAYTKICIDSIRETCYDKCYKIIVVDNASNDGSLEWLRTQSDIILIENDTNTGFPAGCNQGILSSSSDNDIFLLNSDTIMLPNSLFWLRIGLYNDSKTGATGAITNYASNEQMTKAKFNSLEEYIKYGTGLNVPSTNAYELKSFLAMFAMLIKREALDSVGLLDERFTPGNFEDNDYGIRLLANGYNCVLCHNSYIFHFGSQSFRKDAKSYETLYMTNREKYKDKWGFYDDYYTHARNEVIKMINSSADHNISVFEVGCGLGETLSRIKYLYPNSDVHGIEIVENIASLGANRLDIECGDIESVDLKDRKFDYILFPDVLEHLRNPEVVLVSMLKHLKSSGYIIASIPNIMNAPVILDLLAGNFTYENEGILDRTHLRFFTLNEIVRMFDNAGYTVCDLDTVIFQEASTNAYSDFFEKLLAIDGVAQKELFDVYQFIVKAQPK